eukprot:487365_1
MATRYQRNYIIVRKSPDIQQKTSSLSTVGARKSIFSIATNKHRFWSYDAYLNYLLIHGYIRTLKLQFHPRNIINTIFSYYQSLIPSFIIHSVIGDVTNLYCAEWKEAERIIDINSNITINKSLRNVIEPSAENKWCNKSKITLNNITYPLQYIFSIKLIDNMLNNNVYIGIRSNTPKKKYEIAYCMTSMNHSNNDKILFKFKKYPNYRKQDKYSMNDGYGVLLDMLLLPKIIDNKHRSMGQWSNAKTTFS